MTINAASDWVDVFLDVTRTEVQLNGARPTIISRCAFIVVSSMYDAWCAYDPNSRFAFSQIAKRPPDEQTEVNRVTAIAYAAFRSLLNVYPQHEQQIALAMTIRGFDASNVSEDPSTAIGIGNLSAKQVIVARRHDGSNQYGDAQHSNGAYSDYTGYVPVNTADHVTNADFWQPIEFTAPDGRKFTPSYLTPHWGLVEPFALQNAQQFRPGPPPKIGSRQMAEEVQEVIFENAFLTLEKKAIVELMRDGPMSTSQPGQWLTFGRYVSTRDKNTLATDIKMYFALAATGLDAFIAAWETKRYYNSARPWTLVRHYCKDGMLQCWGGPGQGTITKPAEDWHPYSPLNFITPPFPGYVSGHSVMSSASARLLELFTGSDYLGYSEDWLVGSLTEDGFPCYAMQQIEGRPQSTMDRTCRFRLNFPTFTSVAEIAGISRIYGGFHIQADNVAGLVMGRQIAATVWQKINGMFG